VNAYEVKAGIGVIAGKTVWSMPERCVNTLTYLNLCRHAVSECLSRSCIVSKRRQILP